MIPFVFVQSTLEDCEPKCLIMYDLTVVKGHRAGHGRILVIVVERIRILYVRIQKNRLCNL